MKYVVLLATVLVAAVAGYALGATFGWVGSLLVIPTGLLMGWGGYFAGEWVEYR